MTLYVGNQVFYRPTFAPRRIEPFMPLYAATAAGPGTEYMQLFTAAGYAIAAYDAGLAQTGNIEVRFDVALDDWMPDTGVRVVVARATTTLLQLVWYAGIGADGRLHANTKDSGGVERDFVSNVLTWPSARYQCRFALELDDGAGNATGQWYRRAATAGLHDTTGWTDVGTTVLSTFASLATTTVPAVTMANAFSTAELSATGDIYHILVYNGVGGTIVSDLNFDESAPFETSSWDDQAQVRIWEMQGSEGIDWLHSTTDLLSSPGGALQLEGSVSALNFNPTAMMSAGGVLQLVGGVSTRFIQQAVSVLIAGQQHSFLAGSLGIMRRAGGRSTLDIDIVDKGAAYSFQFNQEIKVIGLDGQTPEFVGWIDRVESESWLTVSGASQGMIHKLGCKDNQYLLDKRIVFAEYANQTAGSIVENIIDTVLAEEGVTKGVIEDGATVGPSHSIHGQTAAAAVNRLADLSNFVAKVNFDRSLDFRPRGSVTVPVISYGTGMLKGTVRVRRQNQGYRNRQYVVGGSPLPTTVQTKTSTFMGNGTKKTFLLPFMPLSVTYVRVNGVDQTFKEINGSAVPTAPDGTRKWYWSSVTRELIHDAALTALAATDKLEIKFLTYLNFRTQTLAGDGATRVHQMLSPYGGLILPPSGYTTEAARAYVDYGSGYVREDVYPPASPSSLSIGYLWPAGTRTLTRNTTSATLLTGQKVTIRYIDDTIELMVNAEQLDEIARNRTIEGGTTSGIVEVVSSNTDAATPEETAEQALGDLNRWSHDTQQVEFQTWNRQQTDGEVGTIHLPDMAISMQAFLIEQVTVVDRRTWGATDTKASPLLYTVVASRQPAVGLTRSHERLSDLLKDL